MSSNRCKPKGTAPLCKCGCGQITLWNESKNRWSLYISGHQNIGRISPLRKEIPPAPLCKCGCGKPVITYRYSKGWAMYLNGHAPRKPHTPEAIQKMREVAQSHKKFGADNPAWRGGRYHSEHPSRKAPSKWRKVVVIVHERDLNHCVLCGATEPLDVHHVDGDFLNGDLGNLVTLCHHCHMQVELAHDRSKSEQLEIYMANLS